MHSTAGIHLVTELRCTKTLLDYDSTSQNGCTLKPLHKKVIFIISVYLLPNKTSSRTCFQQTGKYNSRCYILISTDHTSSIDRNVCNLAMFTPLINTWFSNKILYGRKRDVITERGWLNSDRLSLTLQHVQPEVLNGSDKSLGDLKHRFTMCAADQLKYNPWRWVRKPSYFERLCATVIHCTASVQRNYRTKYKRARRVSAVANLTFIPAVNGID